MCRKYSLSSMVNRLMLLLMLVALTACSLTPSSPPQARLQVADVLGGPAATGFARATEPRAFSFPADHGPHPEYAAEWWYYTGNLATADGERYGFQLTFFRFALTPTPARRTSDWATSQIAMAHFALSDGPNQRQYAFERFSRAAAGLAGAQATPFRVWLEDWQATGLGPMRLQAAQDGVAIDLLLELGKPVVLQGDGGLSQKSAEPGNASYYYSLTRMPATGTIQTPAGTKQVTGLAWMDREWSTSALGTDQVGWDWFALQLDDGRDLMYYQLRNRDGSSDPFSKGILVAPDGTARLLASTDVVLTPASTWHSPASGGVYPIAWNLRVPSQNLDLQITALFPNQELPVSVTYWEGAVIVSGSASGRGYLEMTGYADQQARQVRGR